MAKIPDLKAKVDVSLSEQLKIFVEIMRAFGISTVDAAKNFEEFGKAMKKIQPKNPDAVEMDLPPYDDGLSDFCKNTVAIGEQGKPQQVTSWKATIGPTGRFPATFPMEASKGSDGLYNPQTEKKEESKMNVEFSRDVLEEKLSYARVFTEAKGSMQRLDAVLCEAKKLEGGRTVLQITTTNLETSYVGLVDCDVKEEGTVCLNAAKLLDIVKTLNREAAASLTVTKKDPETVLLKSGRSKFKLKLFPPEEFPKLSKVKYTEGIPINPFTLSRAIRKAKKGTSKQLQTGRVGLESLLFRFEGKDLKKLFLVNVGTDGHRLAYVRNKIPLDESQIASQELPPWIKGAEDGKAREYVLPISGLLQLERVVTDYLSSLKEGDEEIPVEVAPDEETRAIAFAINDSILHLQCINMMYPDFEAIRKHEFGVTLHVDLPQISAALKRVAVLTDSKHREVTLKARSTELDMKHVSAEIGEAQDTVACELMGEPWELNFNVTYLREGVQGIAEEEDVLIEIAEGGKPVRIRGSKNAYADEFEYILMPLRI